MYYCSCCTIKPGVLLGFFEDEVKHTFGTLKKDRQRPLSNFTFSFLQRVIAHTASSTGFIVRVTPESIGIEDSDDESEASHTRYSISITR
jgi:hypothetical protein